MARGTTKPPSENAMNYQKGDIESCKGRPVPPSGNTIKYQRGDIESSSGTPVPESEHVPPGSNAMNY